MRFILATLVLVACTKPNPDRCCNDEADCTAQGLPIGSACTNGLICRGNQCIAETCASSADCDAASPYCAMQLCANVCTDDSQCPGFGESEPFCVGGACVTCRVGMSDCPETTPVCDANACRTCVLDLECASNVCDVDTGACVSVNSVLYASSTGSDSADCSQANPCSVTHAITLVDTSHTTIRLLAGSYVSSISIATGRAFSIIGTDAILEGTTNGTISALDVEGGSTVMVRGLDIARTVSGTSVTCGATSSVTLRNLSIKQADNSEEDVYATNCHLTFNQTTGFPGFILGNSVTLEIDRSEVGSSSINSVDRITETVTNSVLGVISLPGATGVSINVNVSFSTFTFPTQQNCITNAMQPAILFDNDIFTTDPSFGGITIIGPELAVLRITWGSRIHRTASLGRIRSSPIRSSSMRRTNRLPPDVEQPGDRCGRPRCDRTRLRPRR